MQFATACMGWGGKARDRELAKDCRELTFEYLPEQRERELEIGRTIRRERRDSRRRCLVQVDFVHTRPTIPT